MRRFQISDNDSREFLGLFAAILEVSRARSKQLNRRFEVPPGALLVLRVKGTPSLAELADSVRSREAPRHWPAYLVRRWEALNGGVFWHALERGAALAPTLGVADGGELCRALAAVAQTLLVGDEALQRRNEALANKYFAAPLPVAPVPQASRPKPVTAPGAYVETDALMAIHASHVGPSFANKSEDQDATRVLANGSALVFALADGVSTSLGARAAARTLVDRVCGDLAVASLDSANPPQLLMAALEQGRQSLDDLLARFIVNPELATAGIELPRSSAIRILDNTRTGANRRLPSALNTTLIAGIVRHRGTGAEATLLRIGDGIVEHVRGSAVQQVFAMDAATTQIASAVGPGISKAPVDDATAMQSVTLERGDVLVISSDGLVRGHDADVWSTIAPFMNGARWTDKSAPGILQGAATAADAAHREDPRTALFDDNLSIVMITTRAH